MLELDKFKTLVDIAPLVSIDFIIKNQDNKILLGKRVNKPACGYFFTLGGRVFKNETINEAKKRVLKDEIGLNIEDFNPKFIGVFEHFYKDSFVDDNISTHYVNLAYEINISYIQDLPNKQHSNYIWLSLNELLNFNEVHKYVKDYFN
ncbi:GDP-mannose mannosyl hydrolase [Aliarcobacter butzleri]|uniref:GDP-mannose mannosyl hydrolase n=1 Tax=Aliarcobacter butzleri TaxID=28197 RepID=A0AAP4UXQ7_9BACT|nr:GDP-mannose mannosyl hydrolase [Aliarcobacter butzleri]MDN5051238.1 GDP-mannose mannosyl hydrolase [Aliarcobacter butzleri]MDN5075431.1 GDP-mannose mannosyl hydrolase [Aliarcobacter butzleri]MDN5117039.1 GDP-mannose mannosyl hydrolase [Aliarcobacter butzleri]MDN5131510.1 GDP-mannose mannosyl hydrolase [Aliarcobacter butzleri]NUW26539.1 GDP-mannose mannosyl hydrolase [Aliarcobacter butzleri]